MATSRFLQITDKEINEIETNSILKNTKDPTFRAPISMLCSDFHLI